MARINTMPVFGALRRFFRAMRSAGPPPPPPRILVVRAAFKANFWYGRWCLKLILAAAYTLWLVKRTIFGPVANANVAAMKDIDRREFLVLAMLAVAVLLLGLWPAPLLDVMRGTIEQLTQQILATKL